MKTILNSLKVVVTVSIMFFGTTVMAQTVVGGTTTTETIDAGEVQRKTIDAGKVQTLSPGAVQQIDKPAVKRLDLPEYDIKISPMKLRGIRTGPMSNKVKKVKYIIKAINKGTKTASGINIKVTVYNKETKTLLGEKTFSESSAIRPDLWTVFNERVVELNREASKDKIKVKIVADPGNRYRESRANRLNNVYESELWK